MIERTDTFIASLGLEAYRVGGSVRDEILGRPAKDADYVVFGVTLSELHKALMLAAVTQKRRISVTPLTLRDGQQGGFRISREFEAEIMLPRTEISTGPGHGDFELVLDPNIDVATDAQRRDFTWNAIYKVIIHPDNLHTTVAGPNGVIYEDILDPLGGLEDLERMRVQVTHRDSFRDDPLRILRALRFVSTLGYELAPETRALMALHADAVTGLTGDGNLSGTVLTEMDRLLMGPNVAEALSIAADTGVLGTLFPELDPMIGFEQASRYHDMTTDQHTFKALETAAKVDAALRVRWALLFHDAGKPESAWTGADGRKHYYATVMQRAPDGVIEVQTEDHQTVSERLWRQAAARMNAPKALREDVAVLIREHMLSTEGKFRASKVRRLRVKLGDDILRDLILHRMCDACGKGKPSKQTLERLAGMEFVRAGAQAAKVPASAKELAINGRDVAELGAGGRDIGRVLAAVLDEVVVDPKGPRLERDWQLECARRSL